MERFVRWAVAALVTVVAFAVPTWISGKVVLVSMLEDSGTRWGVAAALGAALAALAATWGHGFATGDRDGDSTTAGAVASGPRAVAIGGGNAGTISTGDTGASVAPPAQRGEREPSPGPVLPPAAPGTVTASGPRSIAIGGDNTGHLSTGDHHGREEE